MYDTGVCVFELYLKKWVNWLLLCEGQLINIGHKKDQASTYQPKRPSSHHHHHHQVSSRWQAQKAARLSGQLFPSGITALATSHILSSSKKTWNVNQIYTELQCAYFKLL